MSRMRKMTFVGIIFVLVLIATYLFIPSAEKQIELKTTFLEFEYGSVFTITKNDLFDEDVQFEDLENANLVKGDQLFAEVGIHPVMINYKFKDKEYEQLIDVSIVDRTSPTVEMLRVKLATTVNTPLKDYEQFIVASDLSPFEINFDDSQVNYNVVGEYILDINVVDNYSNTTFEQLVIEVVDTSQMTSKYIEYLDSSEYIIPYYKDDILIVNKKFKIPSDFANQEDYTAAEAFRVLIKDMQNIGYDISNNYSGFRSYTDQTRAYNSIVNAYGKEHANKVSAHPGHSEHQSGFTFDLKHRDGTLVTKDSEVKWIADNAHKYGFIVRYPNGKESITGYSYEPWHLRYVGDISKEIYASGLSLEEFMNVLGGDYY